MVVIGTPRAGRSVEETAASALRGGARLLELRVKAAATGDLVEIARRVAALCDPAGALLLVNDDAGAAVAAGADGVHVGQTDLPPVDARRVVGPERLVGLSVHDAPEAAIARAARNAGALDYVGIGTVFSSALKSDLAPQGPEGVRALLPLLLDLPGYAIGGIGAGNVAAVMASGVHGVAVSSAIEAAPDPEAATRALWLALERRRP